MLWRERAMRTTSPARASKYFWPSKWTRASWGGSKAMSIVLLSLTVIPVLTSYLLKPASHAKEGHHEPWLPRQAMRLYEPLLRRVAAEKIVLLSSGGSDWIGGSGRAERVEGGYRVTARKMFVSGAPAGDILGYPPRDGWPGKFRR